MVLEILWHANGMPWKVRLGADATGWRRICLIWPLDIFSPNFPRWRVTFARIPVWKSPQTVSESKKDEFERRYGLWIAIPLLSLGVGLFFYTIAPMLPGEVLSVVKVTSFGITSVFGVIGVVTDFKDAEKRLTRLGKLNLLGLILAGVVGVISQRAEDKHALAAANAQTDRFEKLTEKSQLTLREVDRTLESIGDTIVVNYAIKVPTKENSFDFSAQYLLEKAKPFLKDPRTFSSDGQIDSHTRIRQYERSPHNEIAATFDPDSFLVHNQMRNTFHIPFFQIYLYSQPPTTGGTVCPYSFNEADAAYAFSGIPQAKSQPQGFFGAYTDAVWAFSNMQDYFIEGSGGVGATFKMVGNKGHIQSALDFENRYFVAQVRAGSKITFFEPLQLKVGRRELQIPFNKVVPDKCGNFVYKIPAFSTVGPPR
jgi:hypothetical protein